MPLNKETKETLTIIVTPLLLFYYAHTTKEIYSIWYLCNMSFIYYYYNNTIPPP